MLDSRAVIFMVGAALVGGCRAKEPAPPALDPTLVAQGKDIFRSDTFGDESFWTGTLRMNEVIQSAVDPTTALSVGLKVDAEALPGVAPAERGRGREGNGGERQRGRHAHPRRHHLRAVPLDGG